MKATTVAFVTLVIAGSAAGVIAQQAGFTRNVVQTRDLSMAGREVVSAVVDIQPGVAVGAHTHPGEEVGYVMEGSIVLEQAGQPTVTLNAGQAFLVPPGTVHNATSTPAGKAKVLATYIVEKGKPLATPAGQATAAAPAAQAPAAAPAAPGADATVVAKPTYVSIPLEIAVNKPAAEVWKRIGKYCDIGEWLRIPCTIASGKDGEFGAVRSVATEVLVGKTELSYTYTQPVRAGRPYDLYHGTLEARPVTATTSKLVYTLVFDNSMLADDAARERDIARRTTQFTTALQNMKILAEGGTLPPAPPRAGGPGRGN